MGIYYLGIDGGQTHAAAMLLDAQDHVIARVTVGPTQVPTGDPVETWDQTIAEIARPIESYLRDIAAVGIGATGVGTIHTVGPAAEHAVRRWMPHARVVIANDSVVAWWGAGQGHDSAVLIAGTGSIAYGAHAGRATRCGGYGYLLGDEGSGSWIALAALRHVLRASEGRAQSTRLGAAALEYFEVTDATHIAHLVYAKDGVPLARVAGFSACVGALADDGDEIAQALIAHAAAELADLAHHLLDHLLYVPPSQSFSITPIGRTWEISPRLLRICQQTVIRSFPYVVWSSPAADPSTGAAWMARAALAPETP